MTRGHAAFTFAVPTSGWGSDGRFWFTGHSGSPELTNLTFFDAAGTTPGVFADPCAHEGLRAFDRSVAGDAEAIASVPGTQLVSGPSESTVDGRPGLFVEIVTPADPACDNTSFWLAFNADCPSLSVACTSYPTWLGSTIRSWFIDVGEARLSITAETRDPAANPDLEQEIQQIVDSIRFE